MNTKLKNSINWLLPLFLILFILEVIAFPFAVGITYAGRSEAPNHTLTYFSGELIWKDSEGIDENGVAQLSVFDAEYEGIASSDGSSIIAPGTEGFNIIRLKNDADKSIEFKAALYEIKSNGALPVEVSLADGDFRSTSAPILPEGVREEQIIRSVSGSVNKNEIVDFDISWLWNYEVSDEQNMIDVDFGNKSANGEPDDIKVGFYLIVEEDGEYHAPQTGESGNVAVYIALMLMSGGILLILTILKKREKPIE